MTPEQQVRQLRTEAQKPGAQDLEAQNNRHTVLEALYHLAGRHHKDSTMHGLFTGLNAQPPDTLP